MLRLTIDSCLHHLQAILTGFLVGLGSLEYSHTQAMHAKVLAYTKERRNCTGGSGSWSSAVNCCQCSCKIGAIAGCVTPLSSMAVSSEFQSALAHPCVGFGSCCQNSPYSGIHFGPVLFVLHSGENLW